MKRALNIYKNTLGHKYLGVALSYNTLGLFYESQGQINQVIEYFTKASELYEIHISQITNSGSDQKKHLFLSEMRGKIDSIVSFHNQSASENSDAADLALRAIFQHKGRILDALAYNIESLRETLTPSDQTQLDELNLIRSQLASLIFTPANISQNDKISDSLLTLQKKAEELEDRLFQNGVDFNSELIPQTIFFHQNQCKILYLSYFLGDKIMPIKPCLTVFHTASSIFFLAILFATFQNFYSSTLRAQTTNPSSESSEALLICAEIDQFIKNNIEVNKNIISKRRRERYKELEKLIIRLIKAGCFKQAYKSQLRLINLLENEFGEQHITTRISYSNSYYLGQVDLAPSIILDKGIFIESIIFNRKANQLEAEGKYTEALKFSQKSYDLANQSLLDYENTYLENLSDQLVRIYSELGLYKNAIKVYESIIQKIHKKHGWNYDYDSLTNIYLDRIETLHMINSSSNDGEVSITCARKISNKKNSADQNSKRSEYKYLEKSIIRLIKLGCFNKAYEMQLKLTNFLETNLKKRHPLTRLSYLNSYYLGQVDLGAGILDNDIFIESILLNRHVNQLNFQGQYSQALGFAKEAYALANQTLIDFEYTFIENLRTQLVDIYKQLGQYSDAIQVLEDTVENYNIKYNSDASIVADIIQDEIANLHLEDGNNLKAISIFNRTLDKQRMRYGPTSALAQKLDSIAKIIGSRGNYVEAERMLQESLEIRLNHEEYESSWMALSKKSFAELALEQGFYNQAEEFYNQALNIYRQDYDFIHPDTPKCLKGLAILHMIYGEFDKAKPLLDSALSINRKIHGTETFETANSLLAIYEFYRWQKLHSKAESQLKLALPILEKIWNIDHPFYTLKIEELAELYILQGKYDQAEPLLMQSLAILKESYGRNSQYLSKVLTQLSKISFIKRKNKTARLYAARATEIQEKNLSLTLIKASESDKRDHLDILAKTANLAISIHLEDHQSQTNLKAAKLGFTASLNRKGRILETISQSYITISQSLNPGDQELFRQLKDAKDKLSKFRYNPEHEESFLFHESTTQGEVEDIENMIFRRNVELSPSTPSLTIEDVQQKIPKKTILVELVKYQPFSPTSDQPSQEWGKPRYLAYLLQAKGDFEWVDLGEAAPIEQAAIIFRQALQSKNTDIKQSARILDQKLMQPIRDRLGNTQKLLIAPDSQLNLIPFAALVDENNQYLVENYQITYLTSGRDLLHLTESVPSRQAPIVIADPDYDASTINSESKASKTEDSKTRDLTNLKFSSLPGTAAEAEALQNLLPTATILTQDKATENALKQVQGPQILHIATHGFFLDDLPLSSRIDESRSSTELRATLLNPNPTVIPDSSRPQNLDNALLRSGLALTGFNPRQSGEEDGVVTALEAAGLDLRGTKLVVLSACDTGIGDVANGEGVYGLRRAFVIAGAESQLLSLWKVSDLGTKEMMEQYYQGLIDHQGRSEALQRVQLKMLNGIYQHPYYWAAFIPSGDWRPIDLEARHP